MIFTVKKNYVKNVIKKIDQFFSPKNNIFYERRISWPINTKKQFDFANMDYIKVLKFINEIKKI